MRIKSDFQPAKAIKNRHFQTLYGPLMIASKLEPIKWTQTHLMDGDVLDIAWFGESDKPIIVILHGLEGSYQSHYVQRVIKRALMFQWQIAVVHLRGCGPALNKRMEGYHSGLSSDLEQCVVYLDTLHPKLTKVALGFSLGGNILLKWLGENPNQTSILSAMAVSVPVKLWSCANAISSGFSRVYQRHLISLLKQKMKLKQAQALPGPTLELNINDWKKIRTFWQFDDLVTAPLHGFKDVHDYYQKASSYQYFSKIKTPSLLLHALDDPFMESHILDDVKTSDVGLMIEESQFGGHVGFIDDLRKPFGECFLSYRVIDFFSDFVR